jgi:hypothetical protein
MNGPIDERTLLKVILRAQRLTDLCQFQSSSNLLVRMLEGSAEAPSARMSDHEARIVGLIAFNHFKGGDVAGAVAFTERAKRICEERGDREGAAIYSENLAVLADRQTDR